jgi:hypothetical protein
MSIRERTVRHSDQLNLVEFFFHSKIDPFAPDPPFTSFEHAFPTSSFTTIREKASALVKGTHDRKTWNSFEHYKSASSIPAVPYALPVYILVEPYWLFRGVVQSVHSFQAHYDELGLVSASPYGDQGQLDEGLPSFENGTTEDGFIPLPEGFEGMQRNAIKHMLPLIKAELSLVNTLLELKDIKSIHSTLKSIIRAPISFLTKRAARRTLQEWVRLGAELVLQKSFNLGPLASDIAGLYTAMSSTVRRINRLIAESGRLQTKHFRFRFAEFPDVKNELLTSWYPSDKAEMPTDSYHWYRYRSVRNVSYSPSIFHAEIQFNYNYTEYQREHARFGALQDALGVNLNPGIIWNAIPWSFVVDWFINIGRYLDSYKLSHMEPKINIHKFLSSVSRERTISVSRGIDSPLIPGFFGLPDSDAQYHYPVVRQTAYRRVVSLPGDSLIQSSGLNSQEFTLGAALVLTRRRKAFKRRGR